MVLQVDQAIREQLAAAAVRALAALALAGCGSEGGGGEDATEAPLCDPPADLACPEGMTTEVAHGTGDVTVCVEPSGFKHPMLVVRDGDVMSYSAPPFETRTECWPPAGDAEPTAWRLAFDLDTETASAECFARDGTPAECADVIDLANAAWGFGQ